MDLHNETLNKKYFKFLLAQVDSELRLGDKEEEGDFPTVEDLENGRDFEEPELEERRLNLSEGLSLSEEEANIAGKIREAILLALIGHLHTIYSVTQISEKNPAIEYDKPYIDLTLDELTDIVIDIIENTHELNFYDERFSQDDEVDGHYSHDFDSDIMFEGIEGVEDLEEPEGFEQEGAEEEGHLIHDLSEYKNYFLVKSTEFVNEIFESGK